MRDRAESWARSLALAPSARTALGLEAVDGLRAWLAGVGLLARVQEVETWAAGQGRESLEAVRAGRRATSRDAL